MQPFRDDGGNPHRQHDHHRDNQQTSHPATPTAWWVTYLLQRPGGSGWQRHKSPHAASLDAANKRLDVTETSSSRLQERVDLTGEVEVAFVATAVGQNLVRFTLVAGQSSKKFALIAGSGRDASELCQALDRQGVAVAGMDKLPDAVFLRGGDRQTSQALEASVPSLSRPEVQAYIVRLLFQDSFHQFVGDLSEMFSQVQTHLPVPESAATPTMRTPINVPAAAVTAARREDNDSGGNTARERARAGVIHGVARRDAAGAGRREGRDGDGTEVGGTGGGGGGRGGRERAKSKGTAQASRGGGRGGSGRGAGRGGGREGARSGERGEGVVASLRGQQGGGGGGTDPGGQGGDEQGGLKDTTPDLPSRGLLATPVLDVRPAVAAPPAKIAAAASAARGKGNGNGRIATKGSSSTQVGAGTAPPTKRPRAQQQQQPRQRQSGGGGGGDGGGGGGGASGSSTSSPNAENVGEGFGGGAEKEKVVRRRTQPVGETATGGATTPRRTVKAGGAGAAPDAAGAGRDRGGRGGAKPRGNDKDNGNGNGRGNPRKRKGNAAAAATPPDAAVRAPATGVSTTASAAAAAGFAAAAATSDNVSESAAAEAAAAAAASGAQQCGRGAPLFLGQVTSSGRAPGLLTSLKKKWSQVNKHRSAWAFLKAVNLAEAPGYLDVVRYPLDLESIRNRLDGTVLHYISSEMLRDDLCLMCRNAMVYNDEGTEFHRAAQDLMEFIESLFAR